MDKARVGIVGGGNTSKVYSKMMTEMHEIIELESTCQSPAPLPAGLSRGVLDA